MGESDTLIWLQLITSSISNSQLFLIPLSTVAYESVTHIVFIQIKNVYYNECVYVGV
jgi:hypothetical protein